MLLARDLVGRTRRRIIQVDDANAFELAPVSLRLEDLSGVKALLTRWSHQGMTSVRTYLHDEPGRLRAVQQAVRILKVNRKTLALYEADDLAHLVGNFDKVVLPEATESVIDEMDSLWRGEREFFSETVSYSLSGRRLDIQLRGNLLPGYETDWGRILIAAEDVTDLATTRREMARSEAYARGLFEHSPVSLWVKDFSGVRRLFDDMRAHGTQDLVALLKEQPRFLDRCMQLVRIIDVNRRTLTLYGVTDRSAVWGHHVELLRRNLRVDLRAQLIGLWAGQSFQERETINYTLSGAEIHVHQQFTLLPGHEDDWSMIQVARTDVTARRQAELHLRHLQDRDSLTGLHSRSFFNAELERLMRVGIYPVTVIVADLNGLKLANDRHGHGEGDEMLRRTGEVLAKVTTPSCSAARTGGDEFVILMAGACAQEGHRLIAEIHALVHDSNCAWAGFPLSLSLGTATRRPEEALTATVNRADARMYVAKRHYHLQAGGGRHHAREPADAPGPLRSGILAP